MTIREYVIRTKFTQEVRAMIGIASQGFETYYPIYNKTIRHAHRTETVTRPLFPCYLFAAFDIELDKDRWPRIMHTRGVETILGIETAGHPIPVPTGFVEQLKRETKDGLMHADEPDHFRGGERVRVESGPFTGLSALVELDDGRRVKCLLDILGGKTRISLPREALSSRTGG